MNPLLPSLALCAGLAACAVPPTANPLLTQTRERFDAASQDAGLRPFATDELRLAGGALTAAEQAQADGAPGERVAHLGHLASQRLNLALARGETRQQLLLTAHSEAERERLLLTQRQEQFEQDQRALRQSPARPAPGERGQVLNLGDLRFASGASRLQAGGTRHLLALAEFLRRHPDQRVAIDGFTDNVGSEADNLTLSTRRAEAVREALVDLGVDAARLRSQGHGAMAPLASNDHASGRQRNRRVEVLITARTDR
jgi:outer membrane protein OmpA-like peptidoglycan-associated protein